MSTRSASGRGTRTLVFVILLCAILVLAGCTPAPAPPLVSSTPTASLESSSPPLAAPTTFAVIGDYGTNDKHERAVARLVASWNPDYIVTTGDDYYSPAGGKGAGKYEASTGKYYGDWVVNGRHAGTTTRNAFFPTMGNHDYSDATPSPGAYLEYFMLPGDAFRNSSGNERYYDFVEGPIHFFVLNSNAEEPDGTGAESRQAAWLKAQLEASTSAFNLVVDHHPPYSSDASHGPTDYMQWPFARWGADVVMSGHAHTYERIERDGIVYFVNGLGGAKKYAFGTPAKGSRKRFADDWGAQKVTVADDALAFEFYDVGGTLVDSFRLAATP